MVVRDGFPISTGHTLLIPKRHIGSFFDLAKDERDSLLVLLETAKQVLVDEFKPFEDGQVGVRWGRRWLDFGRCSYCYFG
jgi:diadenosine tetraphosphate (Ap4A) HIT family hydrolase